MPKLNTKGRPLKWPQRCIVDAIFYLLPHEYPPWQTVYWHSARWRRTGTLHQAHHLILARVRAPSAAIIDSRSAKTTEQDGPEWGYDGGKRLNGRKRHVLVEASGLVLSACVHAA